VSHANLRIHMPGLSVSFRRTPFHGGRR